MSTPNTLRFRARGTASVPNFEKEDRKLMARVGRKFVQYEPGRFGFDPTGEDEEVAYRQEYVKACADGDLYAADKATAEVCNVYAKAHGLPEVVFDPTFAGSVEVPKPETPAGEETKSTPVTETSGDTPSPDETTTGELAGADDTIDDPADSAAEKA